jgi:hypothetical protein
MPSTQLLVVKDKVQRYAKQFFNVINIDDDGDLRIFYESTHIVLQVLELDSSDPEIVEFRKDNDISVTVVNIFALVLFEADASSELFKWIATEGQSYDFGAFRVFFDAENPKKCNVQYQYRLAGDNLDPGELKGALAAVAFTADNEDDELQKKFGGKKFSDL